MPRQVRILKREVAFERFVFRIEQIRLQYEQFNGSLSSEINRLVLDRGDSVALLLHDSDADEVLLCEQFRMPTFDKGPGWILELPAGMVEKGEDEQDCARRETVEEIGYQPKALDRIACVYMSPGGSSERIHIFYAKISASDKVSEGGGLKEEGEDIRLVRVATSEAIRMAKSGEIQDAKTLIALQWLAMAPQGGL